MRWSPREAPCLAGLQPAALCSLECGTLGRVFSHLWSRHPEEERYLPGGWGVSRPCHSMFLDGQANRHGALCARGLSCVPRPGLACWHVEPLL